MADSSPYLLLGVMSNPFKPILRQQWRAWASGFQENGRAVRVRYVFGKTVYEPHADPGSVRVDQALVKDLDQNDHLLVDGREKLPHVGVVTEKSAYFWRTATAMEPAAQWYCKCDDVRCRASIIGPPAYATPRFLALATDRDRPNLILSKSG